jgi:hypothetical protein
MFLRTLVKDGDLKVATKGLRTKSCIYPLPRLKSKLDEIRG